jgi:HD-GYP domain-containing protein (c-di-GMP phosphodiesterase class II)
VVDAFDAMVSERSDGITVSDTDALAEQHPCAGTQFDASVVAALQRVVARRGQPAALRS